ncbi:endoplasmic reticulum membrane sensor NFE2L1 isoform X1 [Coregonus clupeaformis]|uniref:endoplasmic reticulum membrane sensor NFE2L1 isoform X1 n=1 Tax=Coregonus clupeaformis TaxID=59861 RepID=UPI001BE022E7|nr:endoplasmic reticulum membrane sensor NFE2L1 isoform X1 [Coregonus clupeaformis]
MVCLKKYFTEGLIQVAILLSLVGVRVDVGPSLPPWHEMILGPTSALTQTQFHNLPNQLDGQDLHPKSVDLDGFFTARRLLGWVRSLDRLWVPSSELETWLVRHEPDALVVGAPSQPAPLEGGAGGLEDHAGDQVGSVMRSSVGAGSPESGYGPIREDSLDTMAPLLRRSDEEEEEDKDEDLYEEDTDTLWQDHSYHGRHQRSEEGEEEELVGDTWREIWRDGGRSYDRANRELAQDLSDQFASLEAQSSMSFQECLRLLEDTFPFGEEIELSDPVGIDLRETSGEDPTPVRELLLSPLLSHEDPSLDLEQQWHDILAIMEPEDMDLDRDVMQSGSIQSSSLMDPVHQDVSLHQAILPGSSQDSYPFNPSFGGSVPLEATLQPSLLSQSSSGPDFDLNLTFGPSDLTDTTLPLALNGTVGNHMPSIQSSLFLEEPVLPNPLGSLLDDALLDEISFLDLALEEGYNATQASQLEEELDSDSGLSLNFSHSPASPSGSEASYSSSSSSSSSDSSVFSDEGAVGYSSDMEDIVEREEGAVGGYSPEVGKMCSTSYQKPGRFNNLPWLEKVGHDHTYNQPRANSPTQGKSLKLPKSRYSKPYEHDISNKLWGRDERRARTMKIPFSNDLIVNLPVEEFNELLTKHRLSEAQLNLIRDIRRRGKNKMAAQNCRRRKLDVLFGLEEGVEGLCRHKARLLKEKAENLRSVREMKQRLSSLYQEVFSRLRDEQGRPLPATDYTLQFGNDGQVLLATRNVSASEQNRKPHKDRKK